MKLLSIVVPTYNMEKYLDRCLMSILSDDSINDLLDVIVVNDGSTDKSLEITKKYKNKYKSNITIIDKQNGGHGSTINAAVSIAQGKYFKVIDADDWVNIDSFGKFVKELSKINSDAIITNYSVEYVFNNSHKQISFDYLPEKRYFSIEDIDLNDIKDDYFSIHSLTYKTSILKENNIKIDEKTYYVDIEYLIFPLKYIDKLYYINIDLYRYFIGRYDQSVSITSLLKHRDDHERVIKAVINEYNLYLKNTKYEKYALVIITTLLKTHYSLYCKGKLKNRKYKLEIRRFNKYLKKHKNLYKIMIEKYRFIRWNIRTNFIFSQSINSLFSRIADFMDRRSS